RDTIMRLGARVGRVSAPCSIALVTALALAGCGRKGGLGPPPGATAADNRTGRRDAATRRGHRRALLPAIARGIIRLVRRQVARIVAVDAAAHGVEASVYRSDRQVVTRRRDKPGRRRPRDRLQTFINHLGG